MDAARCDFCREEIVAASLGASSIITYLPCFHAICQRCKSTHYQSSNNARANCTVPCSVCNYPSTSVQLYDLLIPASICRRCNAKTKLECACSNCGGLAICFPCSVEHQRDFGHLIVPNRNLELPQRSQCYAHPNALATHHCSCGIQLCDHCSVGHGEQQPGHNKTSYVGLANESKKRLGELQQMLQTDGSSLNSLFPQVAKRKEMVHERATAARVAVANEVVEMCNVVIQRGNDIVRAIDLAEDGKMKQLLFTEADLKFLSDRVQKLNFFLQMALAPSQDMPGAVSAHVFADSAYNLIRAKRNQMPQPLQLGEVHLGFSSDASHFLAAVRNYGQLNIDGTFKTPPSTTQTDARMFTVTRGRAVGCAAGPSSAPRLPISHVHHHLPSMSSPSAGHFQQALITPSAGAAQHQHAAQHHHHQQQQRNTSQQVQYHHLLRQYSQQQMAAVPQQQPMTVQRCNSTGEMADGIMSPMSVPAAVGQNVPGSPLTTLPNHFHPQQPQMSHVALPPNGIGGSGYSGAMAAALIQSTSGGHAGPCPSTSSATPMADTVNCAQSRSRATPNLASPLPPSNHPPQQQLHPIGDALERMVVNHQQQHEGDSLGAAEPMAVGAVSIDRPSGSNENNGTQLGASPVSTGCLVLSPTNTDVDKDKQGHRRTSSTTDSVVRTCADSTVVISPTTAGAQPPAAIVVARPAKNEAPEVFVNEGQQSVGRSSRSEVPDSSDLHMRALSLFAASPERIASLYGGADNAVDVTIRAQSMDPVKNPVAGERNAEEREMENPSKEATLATAAAAEEDDRWDDYCYVCQEGVDDESGELGCCDGCPHVYHARCHVPAVGVAMKNLPDDWKCSQCQAKGLRLTEPSSGFGEIEQLLCSTVMLCCFKEPDKVLHFRNDAAKLMDGCASSSTYTPNAITFDDIAGRISTKAYERVENFIEDMNILFRSSSTKNTPSSSKALAGKYVYTLFINATRRYLPAYERFIWNYAMLYRTTDEDSSCSLKIRIKRARREETSTGSTTPN